MNEQDIMKGNIKLTVFDSFDFQELSKIVTLIESQGYKSTFLERGVIVLQKVANDTKKENNK